MKQIKKNSWKCLKGTEVFVNTLMSFDVKEGTLEKIKTTQTLLKPKPNLDKIVKTRSNPH
jgi:hypothetical protein